MREDDLRRHAPKHEADSEAEQDEVILCQEGGVRGVEPPAAARGEYDDGRPF